MVNENQKLYYICENCSKKDTCEYSEQVIQTIKSFIDTPLNIHFPKCKDYSSALFEIFDVPDFIPMNKSGEVSQEVLDIYIKYLIEYLEKQGLK